jgi:arylsulfatase A-like enzyme
MDSEGARASFAVAAVVVLVVAGCGAPESSRPSVVLVVVDQLRKDASDRHLQQVNALAARGVVVEEMRAAAPWTYPAVTSLLTGLYPQQHGADALRDESVLSHVDPGLPLVQKQLREAGFATAAFITNPFLLDWNALHTGFDEYDTRFVGSQGDRWGFPKAWARATMFADNVNAAVRDWFEARPLLGPEFTYVHYIDVHGPWENAPFEPGYESSIRFIDGKIVELYDYLSRRYEDDLLFFVTSDHGRALQGDTKAGFGPQSRRNKRSVHDFNLRIPFVVLPGERVPRARVTGRASSIDFVPTLLEWLALEPTVTRPGISLIPAIFGDGRIAGNRATYARNSGLGSINDGLVLGDRKFLRVFDSDTGELSQQRIFDLKSDPNETVSLGQRFGEAGAILDAAAGDHGLVFEAEYRKIDAAVEERLRALGYLGEPEQSEELPASHPDSTLSTGNVTTTGR